jgi:hypothetical protein
MRPDQVEFDAGACTCLHPPSAHDDGFGCTVRGCECLAGWLLAEGSGRWAP